MPASKQQAEAEKQKQETGNRTWMNVRRTVDSDPDQTCLRSRMYIQNPAPLLVRSALLTTRVLRQRPVPDGAKGAVWDVSCRSNGRAVGGPECLPVTCTMHDLAGASLSQRCIECCALVGLLAGRRSAKIRVRGNVRTAIMRNERAAHTRKDHSHSATTPRAQVPGSRL